MAGLLHGHPQGGRGRRPAAVPARPRRAGTASCATPARRSPCAAAPPASAAAVGPDGVLDVGSGAERWDGLLVPRRQRPAHRARSPTTSPTSCTPRAPRERPRVSSCATAASPPWTGCPQHWLGLGFLTVVSLRDDQRLAPGLRTAARRPERMVPPPFRSRTVDRRRRAATGRWPRFLVPAMVELHRRRRPASPRPTSRAWPSSTSGSAPIAAATLHRFGAGLGRRRGPLRVRHDRVRRRHRRADGRRRAAPRARSGLPLPGVEVRIVDPRAAELPTGEVGQVAIGGTRRPRSYLDDRRTAPNGPGSTAGC